MKIYFFAFVMLFSIISINAQDDTANDLIKQNEIKLNALFMVVGAFDFTYERLINEESGMGIEVFVPFDNDIDVNYYVSPYYRLYFGEKYAAGFFLEGFGMLNSINVYDDVYYNYDPLVSIVEERSKDETNFALGVGLGGKWTTKSGFIGELSLGVGRNLINSDYNNEFVVKLGVTVGYRF